MGNNDQTMRDIDAGKGLKPISTQSSNQSSGISNEQKQQDSGIRIDRFTRCDIPNKNGNKKEE